MTLKFIGPVDAAFAGKICERLRQVRFAPFPVSLEGVGAFPHAGVLLLHGVVEDELLHLQQAVEQAAFAAGCPLEQRPFRPHLTLARYKKSRSGPLCSQRELSAWWKQRGLSLPPLRFLVDSFALYETVGGHYQVMESFPSK
jgi:2'-5' RNA ligase